MNAITDASGALRITHEAGNADVSTTITPLYTRDCYGMQKAYFLQVPRGLNKNDEDAWPQKVVPGEKDGKPEISCLTEQEKEFTLTDWK